MDENFYLPPSLKELRKVDSVQLGVMSSAQIKKYAVCCVKHPHTMINGLRVREGLSDLRMGSTDRSAACETCNMHHPECPGHFGYVDMTEPMFNIGHFELVIKCLRMTCKQCFRILLDFKDKDTMPKIEAIKHLTNLNYIREIMKICGKSNCKHCGEEQLAVGRFTGLYPGLSIKMTEKSGSEIRWYAREAFRVLDGLSDADATIMGFNPATCHPRDLLITTLPIPPPPVRPAVSFSSGISENELTTKLVSIIRRNLALQKQIQDREGEQSLEKTREQLQTDIATYFHNTSTFYAPANVSQTSKMPLKSIYERLKGKYGRLRGNLMGKRVNFSARTVITGDPNIDVDEVGVPFSIAMTLTFPERVNFFNRRRLTETVRRPQYPSANAIINPSGHVLRVSALKPEKRQTLTLNIGDIVERHVIDGDVVLFNRQPTLHRMSMMGHRARVLNFNTFRLNLTCTPAYNADFDGDEMNLHVPQSLMSKAELQEMMMVPKNFVSPNKSAPCMGIVQDSLLGSYRMTDKDIFLDKYFMHSVLMWIDRFDMPTPAILLPRPLWTGKQLYSMVLPDVNWNPEKKNTHEDSYRFSPSDSRLFIQQGRVISGQIVKSVVGASAGSFVHVIFNERGSDAVAKFINGVQRVTTQFLYHFSFSVGMQDAMVTDKCLDAVADAVHKSVENVKALAAQANEGHLDRQAGMTLLQTFESKANAAFNLSRDPSAAAVGESVVRTNSFLVMKQAGSKGSPVNLMQIAAVLAQQNVKGGRIPFGFRRRTLPHFMLDDFGEASRGFVKRGYVQGLQPYEFFFHMMGGREGLIDTAVKTAETGYFQRKLIKAMEDLTVAYDGTVRNAMKEVVQFMYGEDGLDGARIEADQKFDIFFYSDEQLKTYFKYEYDENGICEDFGGTYLNRRVCQELKSDPHNLDILEKEYASIIAARNSVRTYLTVQPEFKMWLPVNVDRVIKNAQLAVGKRAEVSNLNPIDVIGKVQGLLADIKGFFPSPGRKADGTFTNKVAQQRVDNALKIFSVHIQSLLASKRVIQTYKLTDRTFEEVLSEIRLRYQQSITGAGEMIGATTAQSCGEPATQMTLNTFHNAGISSKNVTLGVPRVLELLSVSKNQRNSSMLVCLVNGWNRMADDMEPKTNPSVRRAMHMTEYATLETITKSIQIVFDPNPQESRIAEDITESVEWEEDGDEEKSKWSPWVVRLEIDGAAAYDKSIDAKTIKAAIRAYGRSLQAEQREKGVKKQESDGTETVSVPSERYDVNYTMNIVQGSVKVVRIRLTEDLAENSIPLLRKEIALMLSSISLRGIKGVNKAFVKEIVSFKPDPNTGAIPAGGNKERAVDTEGTALVTIFNDLLDQDGKSIVDFTRSSSDNVPEIVRVLGLEAARTKIINEIRSVYQGYGMFVNYRHYSVLTDAMAHRGYLMAISRVGVNKSGVGPLMRCSFEQTVGVLMEAAAFGEKDPVRGVSGNIVLGNQAKIGTGAFDLMLDTAALRNAVPQDKIVANSRDVNIYHGASSIPVEGSEIPHGFDGQTPLIQDPSVAASMLGKDDASAFHSIGLVSQPFSSSMFGSGAGAHDPNFTVNYSAIHPEGMGAVQNANTVLNQRPNFGLSSTGSVVAPSAYYNFGASAAGSGQGMSASGNSRASSASGHSGAVSDVAGSLGVHSENYYDSISAPSVDEGGYMSGFGSMNVQSGLHYSSFAPAANSYNPYGGAAASNSYNPYGSIGVPSGYAGSTGFAGDMVASQIDSMRMPNATAMYPQPPQQQHFSSPAPHPTNDNDSNTSNTNNNRN